MVLSRLEHLIGSMLLMSTWLSDYAQKVFVIEQLESFSSP